jgi:hypothetical protein
MNGQRIMHVTLRGGCLVHEGDCQDAGGVHISGRTVRACWRVAWRLQRRGWRSSWAKVGDLWAALLVPFVHAQRRRACRHDLGGPDDKAPPFPCRAMGLYEPFLQSVACYTHCMLCDVRSHVICWERTPRLAARSWRKWARCCGGCELVLSGGRLLGTNRRVHSRCRFLARSWSSGSECTRKHTFCTCASQGD